MRVVMQIENGPFAGRKTWCRVGQVIEIGSADWADFPVTCDSSLAEAHFSLQCGGKTCTLRALAPANQVFVNREPVTETLLYDGDEVIAGETLFAVQVDGGEPRPTVEVPVGADGEALAEAAAPVDERKRRAAAAEAEIREKLAQLDEQGGANAEEPAIRMGYGILLHGLAETMAEQGEDAEGVEMLSEELMEDEDVQALIAESLGDSMAEGDLGEFVGSTREDLTGTLRETMQDAVSGDMDLGEMDLGLEDMLGEADVSESLGEMGGEEMGW